MHRSRSSFDDFQLAGAIRTASSLSGTEEEPAAPPFQGVTLVSFVAAAVPPPASIAPRGQPTAPAPPPNREPSKALTDSNADESPESARRPPRLPDLSGVVSPGVRCERIVEWIVEATGASEVFLADASGLPIAGAIAEAEARLAGAGLVASSMSSLAAAVPGNLSSLFEAHIGEGPFFQLIGFQAGSGLFLVGLTRSTPLTPRQAHAVRLACRHALGETLGGGGT